MAPLNCGWDLAYTELGLHAGAEAALTFQVPAVGWYLLEQAQDRAFWGIPEEKLKVSRRGLKNS